MSFTRQRICCVLLSILTITTLGIAQRAIPDDNLAYPVLLTLGNNSAGSGFFLNAGKSVYLVTAKHVLFNLSTQQLLDQKVDLLSYSKDPADQTTNLLTLDLPALQSSGAIKAHPTADVAVVKILTVATGLAVQGTPAQPVPGVTVKRWATAGLLGVALENAIPFKQVLTGNDVMVFGYPVSLGLQQLSQLDPHRPLLRKGIVAGTNPEKQSIIIDCASYFGNSGGPVLELDKDGFMTKLRVIGVVDQYVPFMQTGGSQTFVMQLASNSGYSIVVPMDFVLELIK